MAPIKKLIYFIFDNFGWYNLCKYYGNGPAGGNIDANIRHNLLNLSQEDLVNAVKLIVKHNPDDIELKSKAENLLGERIILEAQTKRIPEEEPEIAVPDGLTFEDGTVYYNGEIIGFTSSHNHIFNFYEPIPEEVKNYFLELDWILKDHTH